jgi:hypothetical protein
MPCWTPRVVTRPSRFGLPPEQLFKPSPPATPELVQEPKEIDDCRQRGRSRQACRGDPAQAELTTDALNLIALLFAGAQGEPIPRRCVAPRAFGIELDLTATLAAPPSQIVHSFRHASMLNGEGLALEARHALVGPTLQALSRHAHLSF